MPDRVCVTSADYIRNIGYWQAEALRHPIYITHHGRDRLILSAAETPANSRPIDEQAWRDALSAAHNLSVTVLDRTSEGFLCFDEHLRVTASNRVADVFIGRAREMIVGAALTDILPSLAANAWTNHLQRVQRSRDGDSFDSEIHNSHLRVRAFLLTDGVAVLFANITEEARLRELCERADAQSAALSAFHEIGGVEIDANARIAFADEAFCTTLSFANHDLKGHRISDIICVPSKRTFQESIERVLRGGERARLSAGVIAKSGGQAAFEISMAPIMSDLAVKGATLLFMKSHVPLDAEEGGTP